MVAPLQRRCDTHAILSTIYPAYKESLRVSGQNCFDLVENAVQHNSVMRYVGEQACVGSGNRTEPVSGDYRQESRRPGRLDLATHDVGGKNWSVGAVF